MYHQRATGVASVGWPVAALTDGDYELVSYIGCYPSKSGSQLPFANETFSPVARLTIDKKAPEAIFAHAQPSSTGTYLSGDDISMAFNENIKCPAAQIMFMLSDGRTIFQDELLVMCSGNRIFADFSPSMTTSVAFILIFA